VRPILKEHCFRCHGEGEKLKGGVDLRLRRFMEKLSKDGDRIMVPGKPDEIEMVSQIRDGDMPPKSKKLADDEIAKIAQWIAQGAKTARPEPEQVPKYYITEEEREFWSFQPIRRLDPPSVKSQASVRNPIDAFILAKLEEKGLGFNPEADRGTLLRRVTLDPRIPNLDAPPTLRGEAQANYLDFLGSLNREHTIPTASPCGSSAADSKPA
jgi:hypothetical protein